MSGKVSFLLPDEVRQFYEKIAAASGVTTEQVLCDALCMFAGGLARLLIEKPLGD